MKTIQEKLEQSQCGTFLKECLTGNRMADEAIGSLAKLEAIGYDENYINSIAMAIRDLSIKISYIEQAVGKEY